MRVHIEINFPYSLKEIYNQEVRGRLIELRSVALEVCGGNRESAWGYLCRPRFGWGDERSLFEQSCDSVESHDKAISAIRQMEYGAVA